MPFSEGDTPLHVAAEENRPALVELLVSHGASFKTCYAHSAHTPLSWAVTSWAFEAAYKLVELGDKLDLFCAAGLGLQDAVESFWKDGKLVGLPSQTGSSRFSDDGDRLPRPPATAAEQVSDALYIACRANRLEVARRLLAHGADPNWRGFVGASCLAWAEFTGNPELCALFALTAARMRLSTRSSKRRPRFLGRW